MKKNNCGILGGLYVMEGMEFAFSSLPPACSRQYMVACALDVTS